MNLDIYFLLCLEDKSLQMRELNEKKTHTLSPHALKHQVSQGHLCLFIFGDHSGQARGVDMLEVEDNSHNSGVAITFSLK